MRTSIGHIMFLVGLAVFTSTLVAQDVDEKWAVDTGREQLRRSASFPWYDQEQDSIRRVDVEPPNDVAGRRSKWSPQPWSWTPPSWLLDLLAGIGWTLFVLVIIGLLYALARAFVLDGWLPGAGSSSDESTLHGDIDRIEALPFQLQRPQSDLLAEARRYYEAGEYGKAIVYLYSYELVQLDKHQMIRLTKGKTNRQYLREMRSFRDLWQVLQRSMLAFEDVFFGHHVLDRDRFEICWRGLDEFHRNLEQHAT